MWSLNVIKKKLITAYLYPLEEIHSLGPHLICPNKL